MAFISGLLGNRMRSRIGQFDITLLPMNLSDGRNIGDLPGLYLFTPPKKSDQSRESDIFIVLLYTDNGDIPEKQLDQWAGTLSDAYFSAKGSFTMGVNTAVKKLSDTLSKQNKGQIIPSLYLNIAILRSRTLLIAHAGPVSSTVISSDNVKIFNDETSLPLQSTANDLSFYTTEVHSEDIILLCPRVPSDWTNSSILEVTGDSPLNAIRFLLDRSGGNLQAAVIQLKTGKGRISFKSKTTITAEVRPEKTENDSVSQTHSRRSSNLIHTNSDNENTSLPEKEKPLFRQRKTSEFYQEFSKEPEPAEISDTAPENEKEANKNAGSLTGDKELPGSQDIPIEELSEDQTAISGTPGKNKNKKNKKNNGERSDRKKFNFMRLMAIIGFGILIPVLVVSVLFFIYSGRSKNHLHREFLGKAVESAQNAIIEQNPNNKESLWMDSIYYVDTALNYGTSPAAIDLRKEAVNGLDKLNGGISTVYNYANASKLPQGLNITDIAGSGQYTYALDATSGSVLRFVSSGTGLGMDTAFTCNPGTYRSLDDDNSSIRVGALRDFVMLPSGNPHSFVLAGIDADANILYCSAFSENRASKLQLPQTERFSITGITFSDNAMYVLDSQASVVWEYLFSSSDGFAYEPSNFYGSYSPYLSDITDFTMYKEYAYFLRQNGSLLVCDYTGYRPACSEILSVESPDGSAHVNLTLHQFSKIFLNSSPDNSIYLVDTKLQSVLNLSVKTNYVRYIIPNRSGDEISQFANASGFGIIGQNRLLWAYRSDLYIGNMP